MSDLNCPYCDADFEVCTDDGHGYDENVLHEDECGACGKKFVFRSAMSMDYYPEKADCLNGAEHQMEKVASSDAKHWPDWVRCKECGHEEKGNRYSMDCRFEGGPIDGEYLQVTQGRDQWRVPILPKTNYAILEDAPPTKMIPHALYKRDPEQSWRFHYVSTQTDAQAMEQLVAEALVESAKRHVDRMLLTKCKNCDEIGFAHLDDIPSRCTGFAPKDAA